MSTDFIVASHKNDTSSPDKTHWLPSVLEELVLELVDEPLDPRHDAAVGRGRAVVTGGIRTAGVESPAQLAFVLVLIEIYVQFLRRRNMRVLRSEERRVGKRRR